MPSLSNFLFPLFPTASFLIKFFSSLSLSPSQVYLLANAVDFITRLDMDLLSTDLNPLTTLLDMTLKLCFLPSITDGSRIFYASTLAKAVRLLSGFSDFPLGRQREILLAYLHSQSYE